MSRAAAKFISRQLTNKNKMAAQLEDLATANDFKGDKSH